ncbi:hypothetical protein OM076_11505 [Solirubrobacter ginsenosidimutans]|uniref:Uncharacterized protein n=1 Tax=Solirubrobacter ginsenosidimutans TaxID=490573 RepID=A0A9X3MTD0_9ACTN|nr:hypothetical protein [Solirubrobacter ginsenosidimutans]MDA0160893.1 hypothetical protein [Solirubrobacter ginsenosidimutans]
MTRPGDREPLDERERPALEREPAATEIPVPEPAVLALQRTAGNQAVARLLMRQPNLTVTDRQAASSERVLTWFAALAREIRQTEPGTPVQSVPELVYMAGELDVEQGKVRDRMKAPAIEALIRRSAREQGIELLEHRELADVRGVQAEATAILGNLDRIPTELSFGNSSESITISLGGKVSGNVGALKFEGETLPEGGAKGSAKIKGNAGEVEIHGSPEGAGTSFKRGQTKVGVDIGKGVKAEVKAGDLVTVKGSVVPEGDGKASWSAQITIGTLGGNVIAAEDIAKVMSATQDTFAASGGALAGNLSIENVTQHGPLLKKAVTDVVEKARKSAAQGKPGWSVSGTVKGDKTGGYSGTVTLTWVF